MNNLCQFAQITTAEEAIIAENFSNIINNQSERLSKMPIPFIYRILDHHFQQGNTIDNSIFASFLFKCLDHHGGTTSLLFQFIKIDPREDFYIIQQLLNENYRKVFNFVYFNQSYGEAVENIASDSSKTFIELNQKIEMMQKNANESSQTINELHQKIETMQKELTTVRESLAKMYTVLFINDDKNLRVELLQEINAAVFTQPPQ